MPNWCENYLRLEVPNKQEADKIVAVLDSDKDDVGLLNHLIKKNHFNNEIESVHISKIHELKLSNDKLTILCISNELLRFFSTYYFSFKGIVCIFRNNSK